MAEVLYYAIPFFVLLLVAEYASFRHLDHDDDDLVGYDLKDTGTSLAMGIGNVVINVGLEARGRGHLRRAVRADAAAAGPAQPADLGGAVLRRRPRVLLVPPRLAREPVLLGQPRRAPLLAALQPLDGAAADLGADDLLPVLAAAAAARLPGLDGAARAGVVADLPVLDSHRAHHAAAEVGRAGLQHALAPPRPPRDEPPVPGQELRRHPDHLGPHVRHLGARAGARAVRADQAARHPPPREGRLPRVHRARPRRPPHAGRQAQGRGAAARAGLDAAGRGHDSPSAAEPAPRA